jgi:hypothetical protein
MQQLTLLFLIAAVSYALGRVQEYRSWNPSRRGAEIPPEMWEATRQAQIRTAVRQEKERKRLEEVDAFRALTQKGKWEV